MNKVNKRFLIRYTASIGTLGFAILAAVMGFQSVAALRAGTMMSNWKNGQMTSRDGFMLTAIFITFGLVWFYCAIFPDRVIEQHLKQNAKK